MKLWDFVKYSLAPLGGGYVNERGALAGCSEREAQSMDDNHEQLATTQHHGG